jgi:hypothetical protein
LAVASPLHQGCGETTTGALASDSDPRRIYVEGIGVSQEPRPCVMTVVNRRWVRVGGSEAASNRRDHNPEVACNLRAKPIIGCGVPEDQTTSMDPQQGTTGRAHLGDEHAHLPSRIVPAFESDPGNRPTRQEEKDAVA